MQRLPYVPSEGYMTDMGKNYVAAEVGDRASGEDHAHACR
jgi:hypothetical protein